MRWHKGKLVRSRIMPHTWHEPICGANKPEHTTTSDDDVTCGRCLAIMEKRLFIRQSEQDGDQ